MHNVVLGAVSSRAQAELAVERLAKVGIHASVIARHRDRDHASSGAAFGAVLGVLLGVAAGFGVIALPGIRALVAAGPVLAAISAAACIGLLFAIVGSALGLLLPDEDADRTRWLVAADVDRRDRRFARDLFRALVYT